MRSVLILALTVSIVFAAAQASAAPDAGLQATVRICTQIKGPFNDWSLPPSVARQLALPARFRGRTWTVLAKGTSCAFATRSARLVLRRWTKPQPGRLLIRGHAVRGYFCTKYPTPLGGRGHAGGECRYLAIGRTFAFVNFGSLSLAQVKRFAARGRLPVG